MQQDSVRLCMAAAGRDGTLITGQVRQDSAVFAPLGYCYRLPEGTAVLTAELGGAPIALGVPMAAGDLQPGEIRLTAGAAEIRLCPTGEVVIYGLVISPDGKLTEGGHA